VYSKPPSTNAGPRVKRGVVISDDDDVPQTASRRKNKSSTDSRMDDEVHSEAERDLRAMMDVDDGMFSLIACGNMYSLIMSKDHVTRVSRGAPVDTKREGEEESTDKDVDMTDDDPDPMPKPQRKKKVKKVIPIGRNGLKKRRTVKSRMTTDDKGYTSTSNFAYYYCGRELSVFSHGRLFGVRVR
jgi:DNA polymerase delta subunit 3